HCERGAPFLHNDVRRSVRLIVWEFPSVSPIATYVCSRDVGYVGEGVGDLRLQSLAVGMRCKGSPTVGVLLVRTVYAKSPLYARATRSILKDVDSAATLSGTS